MKLYSITITSKINIQFLLYFSFIISIIAQQSCDFIQTSTQSQQLIFTIDDIINAQINNKCSKLTLNGVIITCQSKEDQKYINEDGLIQIDVNNIDIINTSFQCDNVQINAIYDVIINNSSFGVTPVNIEKCCSFLNPYNIYISSKGSMKLYGEINHNKFKYGMLLFNTQSYMLVSDAKIKAGNISFHSLLIMIITNSKITTLFVFCHNDPSTIINKSKFTPEKLMQLKMSDHDEFYYQVESLERLSKQNNKTEYKMTFTFLKYYYSLLIYSENDIEVKDHSIISGSRIAVFSENAAFQQTSEIDSTGLGCPANYGLGKGLYFDTAQNCGANGASQATNGGIGLPMADSNGQISNEDINSCIFYLQQSSFVLQNIPYTYSNIYEGSGGAYKDEVKLFQNLGVEGAGGGLITIYTSKQVFVDGLIQSNGNSFQSVSGSGGSGGAITIKSIKIHGNGIISAKGGDSDPDGFNGEGAGGMITLYQLEWSLEQNNMNQFNGTILTNKGQRNFSKYQLSYATQNLLSASKGTFVSFICPAGYEPEPNGYCKQCQVGYYKSGLVGKCRKCSKPSNFGRVVKPVQEQTQFTDLSDCFENCNEFNCDPLRFYVKNVISLKGIAYLLVYIFVLCSGYISHKLLRMKTKKIDSIPVQHVKYDYDDANFAKECKQKDIFFYRDLLYHKYRIQFYGENNINNQWYLQPQIPEGTEQIFESKDFAEFAIKMNQVLKWKKIDIYILKFLNYVYFPLYWYYLIKVQKKVYKKIKDKIHDEPYPKFLKGANAVHQEYIRMKITKSDDYTLLYLDLFNYNKRNQKHFKKTMPTIIHFSGEGSYLKPYYIWPRDHFLQSVFYSSNSKRIRNKGNPNDVYVFGDNNKFHMENSKKFENFISEMNKISSTIDFYSHGQYLLKCFQEMIVLCNQFNSIFLEYLDLKVHILILEIPFNDQFEENAQQRISSNLQNYEQTFRQRITLIEDSNSDKFLDAIDRIQQIKLNQLPYDIKLSMFIFSTSEDMEDLQKQLIPELEIEQDPQTTKQYGSTQLFNPFSSVTDYQSAKMSKLQNLYDNPNNILNENKEEYYQNLHNHRLSNNKQSIAEYMQNCIEKQNNQLNEMENLKEEKIQKRIKRKDTWFSRLQIRLGIFMGFLRFLFLSHKNSKTDKEILIYSLTTLIILDLFSMTFFFNNIYYARIEDFYAFDYVLVFIPFPFVIILTPFMGLFLLTNQSYGMGKAYLIFNLMGLITMFISFLLTIIYIPLEGFHFPIFFLKFFNIIFKILISYCGKYSLLALNKLNKTNMYKK